MKGGKLVSWLQHYDIIVRWTFGSWTTFINPQGAASWGQHNKFTVSHLGCSWARSAFLPISSCKAHGGPNLWNPWKEWHIHINFSHQSAIDSLYIDPWNPSYDRVFYVKNPSPTAGFAWCAIVLPEMVESVPGASVMSGNVSLGGTRKIGESKWMESWRTMNNKE